MPDIGYYTLPVILSFDGVDKQVNGKLEKVFGDTGKKASASFSKAAGSGLKDLEADVAKAAAAYDKLKDKAEDSLGKVRTAEAALVQARNSGNNARVVAAEEKLATARRNSVRATADAKNALDGLDGAQRRLAKGTDDLGGKFGGMSGMASKAGTALAAAGVVAAGAATAGILALAAGTLVAANRLYELGAEFDDVFDNIRIKTGATGDTLETLQDQTKRLAGVIALPLAEIGDVVAEVNRHLHLTGVEGDNVARAIADAGRLTGEAIDVKDLGRLFRTFSVAGKDQVGVMDQLWGVSQSTGISMNELVDVIVKGGPALRDLNLGIGESAALMSMLQDSGIDADKAMGGLTKAAAYLAKEGVTVEEGLSGVFDKIKTLGDAESLELANKVFGAKQGGAFAEVIRNGTLDLAGLQNAIAGTGDTIADAAGDTDDWAEKWQVFKNKLKVALEPAGTAVFNVVNEKLGNLADWVTTHQDEVIHFFGDLGTAAISAASSILTFAADGLRGLADFMRGFDETFKPVFDFMANTGTVLQWVPGFEAIGRGMKTLGEGGQGLSDGLKKVPDFLDQAATGLDTINAKLPRASAWWRSITDRAADANTFTQALGEKVTAMVDGDNQIVLSADDSEATAKLAELGVKVENTNGRITVSATTAEGERIIEAWRQTETKTPLTITPDVDTKAADQQLRGWWGTGIKVPVTLDINTPAGQNALLDEARRKLGLAPGQAPPPLPPQAVPPGTPRAAAPRALGGIYDVWDSVASFATGKLPDQAMIQSPVAGAGLVQWAEPSTGGEAFIPLNGGARSAAIWAETGKRLGLFTKSFKSGGGLGDAGGLQPFTQQLRALITQTFGISDIGGYRGPDGYNEHSSGRALDVMIDDWQTPEGIARGNQIAQWALSIPGVDRVMWQASTIHPDGSATPVPDRGSPTANHMDHVHIFTDDMPTGSVPSASAMSFGNFGSGGYSGSSFSSAGTPGTGPNGESGTYTSDPNAVAEAEGRVAEADAKLREVEAKQRELEADAKESQRISAQNDVDNAKRDAAKARTDLDEAKRGDFTADKDSGGEKKKGFDQFGDVGSLLGGALKETFGFDGSFLPDLSNLAPVKAASALLDAFKGPIQGFVDGKLGIQQPGWQPGMPVNGVENDTGIGGGTSSAPFGMPDVGVPPAPPGTPASGQGSGPAPGPVQNVDQSIHYNAPVGSDPEAVRKNNLRLQEQRTVPRLSSFGAGVGK